MSSSSHTLFQLHANLNSLKSALRDVAQLWQPGDAILLLGATVAYVDWFSAYLDEMSYDEELDHRIEDISMIYVLRNDLENLDEVAKSQLGNLQDRCKLIDDIEWVALTQKMVKVVTIDA